MLDNDGQPTGRAPRETFDDAAIRVELCKAVHYYKSMLKEKMTEAKDRFRAEADALGDVSDEFRQRFLADLDQAHRKGDQIFQSMIDYVERSRRSDP